MSVRKMSVLIAEREATLRRQAAVTFVIDGGVVALHDRLDGKGDARELDQPGRGAFRFQREHAHLRRVAIVAAECRNQLLVGQPRRCVEEVKNLCKGKGPSLMSDSLSKDFPHPHQQLTLLGGWMRFLLAWVSDRKRLFFEPVYSLKLGVWSGRV